MGSVMMMVMSMFRLGTILSFFVRTLADIFHDTPTAPASFAQGTGR